MYLVNKDKLIHVGLEAEDTALKLPDGVYTAIYNRMQQTTTFESATKGLSNYYDLKRDIQEVITEEIEHFFTQDQQRGILVHGGPGNGKTRMIIEIMNNFCQEKNAVAIIGPDIDYIQEIIRAVRSDDPERYIIIFWDEFDEVHNRDEYELLRFLDGAHSHPRVLTIGALNDLEQLEERLYKRPGRFCLVSELKNPDYNTRLKFILEEIMDVEQAHRITKATDGLSLDYVREITMRHTTRGQAIEEIFNRLALTLPDNWE